MRRTRTRRRRDDLAASGNPGRVALDADQHPRHPRFQHRLRRRDGIGNGRTRRPSRGLQRRARGEFPSQRSVHRRRGSRRDRRADRRRPVERHVHGRTSRRTAAAARAHRGKARGTAALRQRSRPDPSEDRRDPARPEPQRRPLPRSPSRPDHPSRRSQTARIRTRRPERPDDPQPRRAVALVGSAGAELRGRCPRAHELRRQDGASVVAGPGSEVANGEGEGIIANSSYEPIASVKAGNGYDADIHEFDVTPEGTAYVDAYTPVCMPTCTNPTRPSRMPSSRRSTSTRASSCGGGTRSPRSLPPRAK